MVRHHGHHLTRPDGLERLSAVRSAEQTAGGASEQNDAIAFPRESEAARRAEPEGAVGTHAEGERDLERQLQERIDADPRPAFRSAVGDGGLDPGNSPPHKPGMRAGVAESHGADPAEVAADVVICVHNALNDVKPCLASVARHTPAPHRIILVDDGSDATCRSYLTAFARAHPRVELLRHDQAQGYTRAANRGLRHSTAEVVVLLNSDTIATPGWLRRLLACAQSDPAIGIVGPLSNAATYQSVPERAGPGGDWALNPLPPGWGPDQVAEAVATISWRAFPRVPFVNGFCFVIKRAVIEAIGYLDEETFPDGYGEENDYCLRAAAAGFSLAVADHAYVYHAKSRSYSPERRRPLAQAGNLRLRQKHGRDRIDAGVARLAAEPTLATLRHEIGRYLRETSPPALPLDSLRVLFLVPVQGGGGGVHSVVQEAHGMRLLGVDARVAIRAQHRDLFRERYPALAEAGDLFYPFASPSYLAAYASSFDVVVGTIFTSMELVKAIVAAHPSVTPAYYVQDYEPWFFDEGTPMRAAAEASYTLVPGTVLFAKTRWLCETIRREHGVEVRKVSPSLDHDVFFPAPKPRRRYWPARVIAMIRPSTPRRGAARTMRVLRRLKEEFAERVEIAIFGCADADLAADSLERDFAFTNHGVLIREQVAGLLRASDVFLDLSDYQAFGRSGLEAMACGCAVVLPARGGVDEYAVDHENAIVVDTSNESACYAAARELIAAPAARRRLRQAGLRTAAAFSIRRAALSEASLLSSRRASPWQSVAETDARTLIARGSSALGESRP
jgi:GT2 family glycosyltransferase